MHILAIDPGSTHSGFAYFRGGFLAAGGKVENEALLVMLRTTVAEGVVLERPVSYKPGKHVDATLIWYGRFWERASDTAQVLGSMTRHQVRNYFGVSGKQADMQIKRLLEAEREGETIAALKGTKKNPGTLYGFVGNLDSWQALALGLAWRHHGCPAGEVTHAVPR